MSVTEKSPTPIDITVRIEELPAMHAGLARAFGEVGIGGRQLDDIFALGVTAKCVGCGITVTGTDLAHIAVAPNAGATVESKLDRLRLGYCARNGCNAKFYRIECENLPGVDSAKIVARALELRLGPPPEPEPEPEAPKPPVPWFKQPRRVIPVAILAVVLYWGFRFASDRGLVPGIAPKKTYESVPGAREAL